MKRGIILGLILLLLVNVVSASLVFNELESVYNLGDVITLHATIGSDSETEGFLRLYLMCQGDNKDFYLSPLMLGAGDERTEEVSLFLSRNFLKETKGECRVRGEFAGDGTSSTDFEISNEILIDVHMNNTSFDPGQSFDVRGKVTKKNGKGFKGGVDISIIDRGILSIEEIDGDTFFTNITLNDNIAAGGYILNIKAYEIYKNEVSNYGEKNFTININQVLRDVGLDLETRNVTPGYNVSYKVSLYDQSGELIEGAVSASIEDVSGETKAYESASGEINYIKLERNAKEGFWKIHTESGGLAVEDSFYVQKNEEIDVYLDENGTLIVENVGNAPYAKDVKFIIGDEIVYKSIALNIGESKKYDVSAPEGVYDIQVEEEGKNIQLDGVALTGNEISIDEIRGDGGISWIIVLVIAIIIVLALIAFLILKKFKKKSGEIHGSATSEKEYKFKMPHKKGDLELLKVPLLKAEHSLVIKGPKEEATLVAVKIKNAHSIKGNESSAMETLEKVSAYICDKKGAVYLTGEYVIGIFSPRLTKTFKNINLGIQVAKEINDMLKKHNQNFNQKIVYGIGVNCGVIISDIGKEIVKFTWLGNEISVSKKIADMAEMKILISDEVKKKLDSSIRTRVEDEKKKLYGIDRINDREEHKEFIQHFLKRQEERKESLKKK